MAVLNKILSLYSKISCSKTASLFLKMDSRRFQNGACERSMPALNCETKIRLCKDPMAVNFAVDMLTRGEIIALPTDTVYGLACNANNSQALQNIYNVKGRSESKPVAICVSEVKDLQKWSEVDHLSKDLLNDLLPGPVTLILYKNKNLNSPFLNPGVQKIGIRIPDYSFIRAVANSCGFPLALTSANLSNEPSSLTITEFSRIWHKLGAIFDGGNISNDTTRRAASTIIDLSDGGLYKVVREGIALQETERILCEHGLKKNLC